MSALSGVENWRVDRMPIPIKDLKEFVDKTYPEDHPLRIILMEKDSIDDKREFLAKAEVWLRLSHQ